MTYNCSKVVILLLVVVPQCFLFFCEQSKLVLSGFIHTENVSIFITATQPVSQESYDLGKPFVLKADNLYPAAGNYQ